MALSEHDERWVKDMIAKSWAEGVVMVNRTIYVEHPKTCPNWLKLKYWIAGAVAVFFFFGLTNVYGVVQLLHALEKVK